MARPGPPCWPPNPPSFLSPRDTAHSTPHSDPQPHGHVPAREQTGLCWIPQAHLSARERAGRLWHLFPQQQQQLRLLQGQRQQPHTQALHEVHTVQ